MLGFGVQDWALRLGGFGVCGLGFRVWGSGVWDGLWVALQGLQVWYSP